MYKQLAQRPSWRIRDNTPVSIMHTNCCVLQHYNYTLQHYYTELEYNWEVVAGGNNRNLRFYSLSDLYEAMTNDGWTASHLSDIWLSYFWNCYVEKRTNNPSIFVLICTWKVPDIGLVFYRFINASVIEKKREVTIRLSNNKWVTSTMVTVYTALI